MYTSQKFFVALGVGLAESASFGFAPPSFEGLGSLNFYSSASGVSADGSVVAGLTAVPPADGQPFRWTRDTGMVALGQLPDPYDDLSVALGVSGDGAVVVGYGLHDTGEKDPIHPRAAFRWTTSEGMQDFGTGPCFVAAAHGASGDGSVVVGEYNCQAFRWTAADGIAPLPARLATGVSADGLVVAGWRYTSGGNMAVRWTPKAGAVDLGDLPGGAESSVAHAVSADGSVIVGRGTTVMGGEAFRWTAVDGMVGLGGLPNAPVFSTAVGVSGDGAIIVGSAARDSMTGDFFLWDAARGMRPLRDVLENEYGLRDAMAGWVLNEVTAISADGRTIVGSAINPAGWIEAWRAHLGDACRADFNADAVVNSQDFFDYLTAFFAADPSADFNRDEAVNSADFFEFLEAFFAGC